MPKSAPVANLLVEIGCEELPPNSLQTLVRAFARGLLQGLVEHGVLAQDPPPHKCFVTPRRLAVWVGEVSAKSPTREVVRRGPGLSAAWDADGKPTAAARGFAKSCGVTVTQLATLKTDKGAWLTCKQRVGGTPLAEILGKNLAQSVRQLPTPKRMRWGSSDAEFVRPVHWLVALHGSAVVKTELFGLQSGRMSRGHRFLVSPKKARQLRIPDADAYSEILRSEGEVIADFDARREMLAQQLRELSTQTGNHQTQVAADPELLDLVTGMVEMPCALRGEFSARFLALPPEVLVACMRAHQKYFHFSNADGALYPAFIAVSNIAATANKRVRRGNERVLRARLADAEFFYRSDLQTPLAKRVDALRGILFHQQLGSLHDKTTRIAELATRIAPQLGCDPESAARAALLCKADLSTDMVGEFPELQGIMGRYYAQQSGEKEEIADAVAQHYLPRRRFDPSGAEPLPQTALAQSVAIADRVDSLVGIFAAKQIPSGDKDPFGLRRAALGVLRILIECKLDLDLLELLRQSCDQYAKIKGIDATPATADAVFDFSLERLRGYYQDLGFGSAQFAAVRACRPTQPLDFDARLRGLRTFFSEQPEAAASLSAANKRIKGILKKLPQNHSPAPKIAPDLFAHSAEAQLMRAIVSAAESSKKHFANRAYELGLPALGALKQPVDEFFEQVLVLDENPDIRANRLAILVALRRLFLEAADISLIGVESVET